MLIRVQPFTAVMERLYCIKKCSFNFFNDDFNIRTFFFLFLDFCQCPLTNNVVKLLYHSNVIISVFCGVFVSSTILVFT